MQANAMSPQREPRVARDRTDLEIRFERQRIEARGAILDLAQCQRTCLELEVRLIEHQLHPRGSRLADIAAAQIELARTAEQGR
jgi:hypothetical protein